MSAREPIDKAPGGRRNPTGGRKALVPGKARLNPGRRPRQPLPGQKPLVGVQPRSKRRVG